MEISIEIKPDKMQPFDVLVELEAQLHLLKNNNAIKAYSLSLVTTTTETAVIPELLATEGDF